MHASHEPPVGQPLHGASLGLAIKRFFRGYVGFSGRASRSEFWWAQLFIAMIMVVPMVLMLVAMFGMLGGMLAAAASADETAMIAAVTAGTGGMFLLQGLVFVVFLPLILPSYAVMWRRLQDANFHGAFSLLSLVGLAIVPFILCFFSSRPEGIRFDPAFRAQQAAQLAPPYGYGQPSPAYGQQPYSQPPHAQGQ